MVIISCSKSLDVEVKRIASFGHVPKVNGREMYEVCFTDDECTIIGEDLMRKGFEIGHDVLVVIENKETRDEAYIMLSPFEMGRTYFKTLN